MLINLDDFSRMLKIERNYSDNTVSAYLSDLKSFDTFLEKNKINFNDVIIHNKHVKIFFRQLSKKKLSPRSIKRKFSSLSSYFIFLLFLHRFEQYLTWSHTLPHFFRHLNGRSHTWHTLVILLG